MGLRLFDLEGRRALVTGAGTGLGWQMAMGLSEAGADLVICGRRREPLEACADAARAFGVGVEIVQTDVTIEREVAALRDASGRVDILVNNAGLSRIRSWQDVDHAEWREILDLNLIAPFRLCQAFAPTMAELGWGRIINVGSVYSVQAGNPDWYPGIEWDLPTYFPSKHGLHGITRYLAVKLATSGVCVNTLSPGIFRTPGSEAKLTPAATAALTAATPMKRLGNDEDLKGAVVFLASDASAFVTGQNLLVDGGLSVW